MAVKDRLATFWREERYRTDVKQFVEFGAGYAVVLVLGYFLLRKVNLTLTTDQMGVFSYVSSWVTILAPVLCLAAPQAYLRFHDNHAVSMKLRRFLLPFFAISSVLLAGFVYWKTHSWFAILYALNPVFLERTYLLRSQMQIRSLNLLRTCELLVPLAGLYLLLPHVGMDAAWVLGLYGLGYGVAGLFRARRGPDADIDRAVVLKYLWPLVFTTLVVAFLNNVAVILAKHFLGYEAAGQMGVAVRALLFLRSLTGVFLMFYPMVYFREAKKGNLGVINLYRAVMLLTVGAGAAAFAVFAPFLYRLVGADEYLATVNVFRILLLIEFLNFTFDIFCSYFSFEIKAWKGTLLKLLSLAILAGLVLVAACHKAELTCFMIAAMVLAATAGSALLGVFVAVRSEMRMLHR